MLRYAFSSLISSVSIVQKNEPPIRGCLKSLRWPLGEPDDRYFTSLWLVILLNFPSPMNGLGSGVNRADPTNGLSDLIQYSV